MSLDVTRCDIQSTCDKTFPHMVSLLTWWRYLWRKTMRARVHSKKEKKFKNRVWRVEKTFQFYHCHFITGRVGSSFPVRESRVINKSMGLIESRIMDPNGPPDGFEKKWSNLVRILTGPVIWTGSNWFKPVRIFINVLSTVLSQETHHLNPFLYHISSHFYLYSAFKVLLFVQFLHIIIFDHTLTTPVLSKN